MSEERDTEGTLATVLDEVGALHDDIARDLDKRRWGQEAKEALWEVLEALSDIMKEGEE